MNFLLGAIDPIAISLGPMVRSNHCVWDRPGISCSAK